jgi:ABC-2 type transport system ATP-binding protein
VLSGNVMIAVRRLHRFYGTTRAVDDISFEVERGQVFGYIGPNGAGKTTSMRVLATLDIPTRGDAQIDGFSVINDPDRVRRRLGYMPDAYGAYPNVSCAEYLDFFARAYGLVGRVRHQAVRRVIEFTRMQPLLNKPMQGLSKGMKQRLCLGRALIHDPAVLILDEPAAGLDPAPGSNCAK